MRYLKMSDIKENMILGNSLLDNNGNILIRQGNTINSILLKRLNTLDIQGLYIDDYLGRDIEIDQLVDIEVRKEAIKSLIDKKYSESIQCAKSIVKELSKRDSLQVNYITTSIKSNYTYNHAVSTCVYATIIGLALGFNEEQLNDVAVAAMLADIGKKELPQDILHKEGKLTKEEYKIVKQHPKKSYDIVTELYDISSKSRNAILYHHENIDGSGYYGINEKQQTIYTRIVHLADVYSALIMDRPWRKAFSVSEAIEMIMGNAGTMFDVEVVKAFTSKFPIYPLGVTVNLSNGEKAIIANNEHNTIRPIIRVFNNNDDKLIDLSDNKDYLNVTIIGVDM